jgi:DNA-binding transcriptional ArsR family regulator
VTPETAQLLPLAKDAASLLKLLAHPARLLICMELRDRERSVGDIEQELDIHQPRLSRELAKLREAGILTSRRDSRVMFYRVADEPRVRALLDAISAALLDSAPARTAPGPRRERPGGYGVFARTVE